MKAEISAGLLFTITHVLIFNVGGNEFYHRTRLVQERILNAIDETKVIAKMPMNYN